MRYNTYMNLLRKALVVMACSLLPIALFTFGLLFSVYQVFGSSSHIKAALDTSGIYDAAIATAVKQTTNQAGESNTQTPTGQAAIQNAIRDAIPASYLKDQTGGVLDGIYAWMQGKAPDLAFAIDLSPVKTKLVDSLVAQARTHAQSLPACSPDVAIPTSPDPFSMECMPAGMSADALAEQTRQTILASDIFKNASITPQTISSNQAKPLQKQLEPLKQGFQIVRMSMYVAAAASAAAIAVAVFMSRPWRSGIKRVAYILVSTGGIAIISAIIGNLAVRAVVRSLIAKASNDLQTKAATVLQQLTTDMRNWWLLLGSLSVAVAIGCIVSVKLREKSLKAPDSTSPALKASTPQAPDAH